MSCHNTGHSQRNLFIEKHLIWSHMSVLHGTHKLPELINNKEGLSRRALMKDIEFRRIHLQSRQQTFKSQLARESHMTPLDEYLLDSVDELCQNMQLLTEELKEIEGRRRSRPVDMSKLLATYRKAMRNFHTLCASLEHHVEQLTTPAVDLIIDASETREVYLKQKYSMDRLDNLPYGENLHDIGLILQDLTFRKECLSSRIEALQKISAGNESLPDCLKKANKQLASLETIEQDLKFFEAILGRTAELAARYLSLMQDDEQMNVSGSRFIFFLERLRTVTEQLEIARYFPITTALVNEWRNDHSGGNDFKPKVLPLCQAVESDLREMYTGDRWIYSIPYKIGVIGVTSAGKSALTMALIRRQEFSRMVSIERSTFGYLQFDTYYEHPINKRHIPIIFIDIEGAIDDQLDVSFGNYFEMITKADCDMYLLVFDKPYSSHNQACVHFIRNSLNRQCLLVRTKSDAVFTHLYREDVGEQFQRDALDDYCVNQVLGKTRTHCQVNSGDQTMREKVFLTALGASNELHGLPFGQFDLEKLRKKLILASTTDTRLSRLSRLAILASRTAINTCFRRGYAVSTLPYRLIGAVASIVPCLDMFTEYLGEEKIRQVFGVHDNSTVTNAIQGTQDSLRTYLTHYGFTVLKADFQSDCFKYLRANDTLPSVETSERTQENQKMLPKKKKSKRHIRAAKIGGHASIAVSAALNISDDVVRFAVPAASAALRGVSIATLVVGIALIPVFASWSYYYTGKRMNNHLHALCDDLHVVLIHFIARVCDQLEEGLEKIEVPLPREDSSSSSSSDEE